MKDFIHRIWYGNIHPGSEVSANNAEINRLLQYKNRHREKLLSTLNEEQMKILEKYESNEEELYCLAQEDAFTEGIRYAVQFLVEAMG